MTLKFGNAMGMESSQASETTNHHPTAATEAPGHHEGHAKGGPGCSILDAAVANAIVGLVEARLLDG